MPLKFGRTLSRSAVSVFHRLAGLSQASIGTDSVRWSSLSPSGPAFRARAFGSRHRRCGRRRQSRACPLAREIEAELFLDLSLGDGDALDAEAEEALRAFPGPCPRCSLRGTVAILGVFHPFASRLSGLCERDNVDLIAGDARYLLDVLISRDRPIRHILPLCNCFRRCAATAANRY